MKRTGENENLGEEEDAGSSLRELQRRFLFCARLNQASKVKKKYFYVFMK